MNWLAKILPRASGEAPQGDPERIQAVEAVLHRLRPHFLADGGDIRLVRGDEFSWVEVRLHGACDGCQMSMLTVRGALEPELKRTLDWVEGLRTV